MFDYGNVSQATIEQEATALSKEMPEVKFATGTKFKRCWIRGFTRRMNWVFKRVQGSKRRIEQEVMDKCQKQLSKLLESYPEENIWNADEGPIFSEMISK